MMPDDGLGNGLQIFSKSRMNRIEQDQNLDSMDQDASFIQNYSN